MLRIQMVLEDYAEIVSLSTVLKKVGFDVDSTQNPNALTDSLLRLNPDVLIMTAYGRRVHGFEMAKQVKKNRGLPHVILLHENAQTTEPDPGVEAWVATPVEATALLRTIAGVCLLNEQVLLGKYQAKLGAPAAASTAANAHASRIGASSLAEGERRARYQKFLGEPMPSTHGLQATRVREQVKALRVVEDPVADADLERERRDFVDQLFKKKA